MRRAALAAAVLAEAALAVVDALSSAGFFVGSLYLLPVLAAALRVPPRDVRLVGGLAVALALLSGTWNGAWGDEWFVPVVIVAAASAIAVRAARERAAADVERGQLRMLYEAAQITDGAADIEDALRRLVDILVPDLADAAWIDVATPNGPARRLAARAHGPGAAEMEAWLLRRYSKARGLLSPSARVLRGEGPQLAELDERLVAAIVSGPEDRRMMEQSGLRMTMAVPLAVGEQTYGALSLGAGRSGRRYGPADLAFAELLAGRAALGLGNAQLVNRLRGAQQRLDGILGALAEAVTVQDARGRIVYANDAAARLFGLPDTQTILGAAPGELFAGFEVQHDDGRPVEPHELPSRAIARGEQPEPLLTRTIARATGEARWYLTKATPLRDEHGELLAVNVIEDVTEEKEWELRERFLTDAGKALSSSLDHAETLQRVAALAVPRLADWCSVELPDERGILQPVALAHVDPGQVAEARALRERYPPDPEAPVGGHAVLRSGRSQLLPEVTDEMLGQAIDDEEQLERARRLGLRSAMIVPMIAGGRTVGVMTFVLTGHRRYDADDLAFAEELASRAAIAVENARLYTERSEVARTLQASLLPEQLPHLPGWRAAADYRAGQAGTEVGGDFYDVFPVEDGAMVILGDVTGKGVTAAALTSLVRHTAKTAAYFDPRPSAVLALVNRALRRQPRIAPVTMVCALLGDGELTLAVGGHPLPFLRRGDEPARRVGEPGLLLGAVDAYEGGPEVVVPLSAGDTLLLYTDGVTDTRGETGRFGDARLRAVLDEGPLAPEELLERVRDALAAFEHGTVADDRAMLALQYVGARREPGRDGSGVATPSAAGPTAAGPAGPAARWSR
jgi:PAS domain S-box-containing protein